MASRKTANQLKSKRLYNRWRLMMSRCYNESDKDYSYYGGRGIEVCERWHDLDSFREDIWDIPDGMSLDRIDNSKGYEPNNIRYATQKEQMQNTRSVVKFLLGDEIVSMAEAARRIGINHSTIHYRLKKNQPIDDLGLVLA